LSDQKEKPNGALPKGYDANTSSTEVVKQKKINFLELVRYTSTDQDQREKDLKEYESSYLARLEKNKPEESSDDFRVDLGVSIESDDDLGKLNLRKHTVTKLEELQEERLAYEQKYLDRYAEPKLKKKANSSLYKPEIPKPKRNMEKERKEYEQKYLSRYKQPKLGVKKLSNLKHDIDAGALTLRQYINAKRKTKQDEIKKYEQKYLSRYKQPKPGVKKLSNLKHDIDAGALTLRQYINAKRKTKQDEIKKYEQKYISRYKQPKIQKKKASSSIYKPEIPKPKRDMKKERKKYEQKYLSRYKQPKTKKNVASDLYKPEIPKPKIDRRKERKEYEQKYLSRYKEWESLCDGCARCCLIKLEDVDTGNVDYTNAACKLLDTNTCKCKGYSDRKELVPDCIVLSPQNIKI